MDLRLNPRVQVTMHVSFASLEFEGLKEGTLYNLSMEGCAVESPTTVEPGMHIALYLDAPGERVPIAIELAKVVRATRREFAAKFVQTQLAERRRLEQVIQTLYKPKVG